MLFGIISKFTKKMKTKEEIEQTIKVFEKLRDGIDEAIKKVGSTSTNFVEINTNLRNEYQSFIDGLKYCIE